MGSLPAAAGGFSNAVGLGLACSEELSIMEKRKGNIAQKTENNYGVSYSKGWFRLSVFSADDT